MIGTFAAVVKATTGSVSINTDLTWRHDEIQNKNTDMHKTSFILSSRSWEIGSPPTGGAGRMKLSCVVSASAILI